MKRKSKEAVLAVVVLGISGCAGAPMSPSPSRGRQTAPMLQVDCVVDPAFRCTASLFDEGDVTSRAVWSAAESLQLASDVPLTASSAVAFMAPGVPRVLRQQNVYIRADYVSPTWGTMRNVAPHAFAAAPGSPAVPLAHVRGETQLEGVVVEIIDGEGAGKRTVTLVNGAYMIEFLRLNRPFTARASKAGYVPESKTHPGIVDGPEGSPSNAFLHFNLSPGS